MRKTITIQCNRCKKDIHVTEKTYRRIKNDSFFPWIWCIECNESFKSASLFIDNEIKNPRKYWGGTTVEL